MTANESRYKNRQELIEKIRVAVPTGDFLTHHTLDAIAQFVEDDRKHQRTITDESLTELRKTLVEISQLSFVRPQAD